MADLYWKGGNNSPDTDDEKGNFNQALNWQTAAGGAGSVPGAADVMHFDKRAGIVPGDYAGTKHTIGKHWNCYHNMASGPDDCQGVVISPDFTGRIGMNAEDNIAHLQLSLDTDKKLIYKGNEPCHIKIKTINKTMPLVIHDSESGLLAIKMLAVPGTAEYTKIECYGSGTLEVEDDTKVIEIHNYGSTIVTIHEGCPAIKIYADSGSIFSDSPLDAVENYGGSIVLGNTALAVAQAAIDIASLLNVDGSFTWRAGGKMTACEQRGGNINVVGDGDKQVGNSGDIFKLLGGTFDASGQYGKFTRGATCGILICDATFIPPKGLQIDDWAV